MVVEVNTCISNIENGYDGSDCIADIYLMLMMMVVAMYVS